MLQENSVELSEKSLNSDKVRYLNLSVTDKDEIQYIKDSIDKIARHGQFLLGPEVKQFETECQEYLGCDFALGLGSGTDALILAMMALGIGAGDEVILPCLSFIGSSSAISMVGASPVFADIKYDYNIDEEKIESLITPRTKAIVVVHFTGRMYDVNKLSQLAKSYNLHVIEDAAQSFGAHLNGQYAGTRADIGCFSMNSMKVLGAWGEAGLLTTNIKDIREYVTYARYHNIYNREVCKDPGINARLDVIQAAVLSYRLKKLDTMLARRRDIASYYTKHLKSYVQTPDVNDLNSHTFYNYSIMSPRRNELMQYLDEIGIESKPYHRLLMPRQPIYRKHPQHQQKFDVGDKVANEILALPIYPEMPDGDVDRVIEGVVNFFKGSRN